MDSTIPPADFGADAETTRIPHEIPTPVASSRLQPDQVLAGRYRIERWIASGGMGEVYEAHDLELDARVALKTIRTRHAPDPGIADRFKREIQLARKVTHPNVCRIFDLGHHHASRPDGLEIEDGDILFLTMELLHGETLEQRFQRMGRMSEVQALPLVRQMAAALSAAHEAGVVHRDFKTSNVMLVPGHHGERAVVTDFGLARSNAVVEGAPGTLTGARVIVGTPAYMAPEQVEGKAVTIATDIYALGVVLYEMMTGTLPFGGDLREMLFKRIAMPAPSPRSRVTDLDPKWEAVILRCLERDPKDRFANGAEVVRALEDEALPAVRRPTARTGRTTVLAAAGLAFAVLVGSAALWKSFGPGSGGVEPRRSVAVLGFKNLSGAAEAAWLSTALSEMLISELSAGEELRTISGEAVARTKLELALPDAESLASDTLARLRMNLGADLVVVGSYFAAGEKSGGKLRLDVRVQDTAAGESIGSVVEIGSEAEFLELVARTGANLRASLGMGPLSSSEASGLQASRPSNPEAVQLYAQGLERLRHFDAIAARDLLAKAVAVDPRSASAHSALSQAWSTLGYDNKAKEAAKRAFELSANLPRDERLAIEARYRESAGEWLKAAEIYRTLFGYFPDNMEHGLHLAEAQTQVGRARDSLSTLDVLRTLPGLAAADPRIDLAEAQAADSISDYKRMQAAATTAVERATAQGRRLLAARARYELGSALRHIGETDQAEAAFEEAQALSAALGDRAGEARGLRGRGMMRAIQGDFEESSRLFQEALAVHRTIQDKRGEAATLNNLGVVNYRVADLATAANMYAEAAAVDREIGDQNWTTPILNLGTILAQRGDLDGALEKLTEVRQAALRVDNPSVLHSAQAESAWVLMLAGNLALAREMFLQALEGIRATGEKGDLSEYLYWQGELQTVQGDLESARKSYEEALALAGNGDPSQQTLAARLGLAQLDVYEGRLAGAEQPAREVAQQFERRNQARWAARARNVLGQSLLRQERIADARDAISPSVTSMKDSQWTLDRLWVSITASRITAASGGTDAAVQELRDVLAEASRLGLVSHQIAARLALGEVELHAGQREEGRRRLEALRKEAEQKGYGLAAREAAGALQGVR